MTYTHLLVETNNAVATVTMNRPTVHNAFDETLIADLTDCVTQLSADDGVRVIVLTGAGASFSAGADLDGMKRMAMYTRDENVADARGLQTMFAAIASSPKATVARVNGAAIGGGAGLVAACDIAIAANLAALVPSKPDQFGFSEVRLGIAPAVIAPFVIQKIGFGAARSLFLTGERFTASEARHLGLVQQVVNVDALDAAITKTVGMLLQSGPKAIAATKQLLRDMRGQSDALTADLTVNTIADLRVSPEGQEGLGAYLEKRTPKFAEG